MAHGQAYLTELNLTVNEFVSIFSIFPGIFFVTFCIEDLHLKALSLRLSRNRCSDSETSLRA